MSPSRVHDPDRLRDLLEAFLTVGADLALPHVLRNIVEAAVKVVGARYGALGVLSDGGGLSEFINVGIPPELIDSIGHLPEGHGILGLLIVDPRPLRLADLAQHPDSFGFPPHHPPMRSFLGVPIRVRDQVFGNLYLTEKQTGTDFTEEDVSLAVGLATAAGVAIENARLHARVRELTLAEDRERIAGDLHDTVIQRLFGIGMVLQGTIKAISPPEAARRVEAAVDDLDETIRQVRSAIFALQAPRVAGRGLRAEILTVTAEAATSLRFDPHLRLDGPIDSGVEDAIAPHVLAVLREALSNVVRHAAASRVDILVEVENGQITVEVRDNGIGPGAGARAGGLGLASLRQRADGLGGSMTITPSPEGSGTVVTWRAPV